MKKFAFAALFVGALGLVACGGGGGDDGPSFGADAATGGGDGGTPAACNPVTQQGCEAGEKCASKVESASPFLSRTACVPNGSVPPGGMCTQSDPGTGPDQGIDDCQAEADTGYECINGLCTEVCTTTPNSCSDGLCVLFNGLFDDVEGAGACAPTCDAVAQDCPTATDGCYYNFQQNGGVCAGVPMEAADQTQDDPCLGPSGVGTGACFLNGCGLGYGPNVPEQDAPMSNFVCAKFCSPADTDVDNTASPAGIEDAANGQYSCASPDTAPAPGPDATPNAVYQCRFFNSFYGDTGDVPGTLGFCANQTIWGDCLVQETANCIATEDTFVDEATSCPDHACCTLSPGCVDVATFASNPQIYKMIMRKQGKLPELGEDLRDSLMDRAKESGLNIH